METRWRRAGRWHRLARPRRNGASVPTPPEAMTGRRTAPQTASQQVEVETLAGAVAVHRGEQDFAGAERCPLAAPSRCTSSPVLVRPPWEKTSHLPGADWRASMATTTHWLPNFSRRLARPAPAGAMAAELMLHLSAPASSRRRISATVRMPPPTVSGRKIARRCGRRRRGWCRGCRSWR